MAYDFQLEGYEDLELSTQVVIRAALGRGVTVTVLDRKTNLILLQKDHLREYISRATETSADSLISSRLMGNKEVSKQIVSRVGIRTPEGALVSQMAEAEEAYEELKGKPLVIKPNSTNMGIGLSFLQKKATKQQFKQAVETALSLDSSAIIEEWVSGDEYRFLVVNDHVQAICARIPANITGDGSSTVEELIKLKNEDPRRGLDHVKPLEMIQLGEPERITLEDQGYDFKSVIPDGQKVFLRRNSNISTGGDSIDKSDSAHEGYSTLAVRAAQAVGARIAGIDLILDKPESEPDDSNYALLELNYNPVLYIHAFPFQGTSRPVGDAVLDMLGF